MPWFRTKIRPGATALGFYAGHGIQIKGQNYFPGVDADIDVEEDVPLQSLNLGTLLEHMEEAKAGVNRVFLDYWQLRISRHRDRHSTALAMRTYMSYSSTHEDETILEIIEGQRRGNNQESGQRWALSGEAKRQADDSAGTWRYRLFPGVSG